MAREIPDEVLDEVTFYLNRLLRHYPNLKTIRIRRGGPNSSVNIIQIETMDHFVYNHLERKE